MIENWTFTETDKQILEDIQPFLPEQIFDIHGHIYQKADLNNSSLKAGTVKETLKGPVAHSGFKRLN